MKRERPIARPSAARVVLALAAMLYVAACSRDPVAGPSGTDYSGNWSALMPHTVTQGGTGVTLTISGSTITAATAETEDYFGVGAPLSGCLIVFTASGPLAMSGSTFTLPLTLGSNPIAGISGLSPALTAAFSGTPTLQGTFTTPTTLVGQLNYTINSASCGGTTFTGAVPTPGFGNQIRTFTASR